MARTAKKPGAKKALVPEALVNVAKAAHEARMARLKREGRDALASIREKQTDIAANMVDIGLALAALKAEGVAEALGRKSFAAVVSLDLGMALSTANSLVALATRVPRAVVTAIGPGRARALMELTDATPEDDAPEELLEAKIKLPSGRVLEVAAATDQQIRDAARELRDARPAARKRRGPGFTASPGDKAAFARFEAAFREHLEAFGARSRLVATRDGRGPKVRIELRFKDLAKLAPALRKALAR